MFSFRGIVDLISILPYYIELIVSYAAVDAENGYSIRLCLFLLVSSVFYSFFPFFRSFVLSFCKLFSMAYSQFEESMPL
jgi:hypothetical protein